jgi:hypothetical protein
MREPRWLRAASFGLTVGGALLAAGATTITWTSSGLRRDLRGLLDLEFRGIDLPEGVATLVVSGIAVALFMDLRRRSGGQIVRAIVFLVTGLALVALPAWVALRAEDHAVEEVAEVVARSAGIPMEEAVARVRTDPDLAVRTDSSGVWPSIAAGVLVTLGGVTTLLWTGRRQPDLEGEATST